MRKLRPRELSSKYGFQSLSTAELLALALRVGTRANSVYTLSDSIAATFERALNYGEQSESFLNQIAPLVQPNTVKSSVLGAIFELAKRNQKSMLPPLIAEPREIARRYYRLMNKKVEFVYGVYVDSRLRIIKEHLLSKGTTDAVYLEPRDVLYHAIKHRTRKFLLVHNHPSGEILPSPEDVALTKRVVAAAEFFQVELVDHIIIARQGYYSFREQHLVL